jgi:hypothetical protein
MAQAGAPGPHVAQVGASGLCMAWAGEPRLHVVGAGVLEPCVAWRQALKYLQ